MTKVIAEPSKPLLPFATFAQITCFKAH